MSAALDIFTNSASETNQNADVKPHIKQRFNEKEESVYIQELHDFLEKPAAIGLDNVKESLRNTVQLMWEIKGYATGYALQHLMFEEHSSLAMDGTLKSDQKKKEKIKDLWDLLEELMREMRACFVELYEHTHKVIEDIIDTVEDEIENLDERIEQEANTVEEAQAMKRQSKKRRQLVAFKEHIEGHEEELEEAETSADIIEVQQEVLEDYNDLQNGEFIATRPKRKPILKAITNLIALKTAANDTKFEHEAPIPKYQRTPRHTYYDDRDDQSSTDDTSSGGNSDTGESDDGSGKKEEENVAPPSPFDI